MLVDNGSLDDVAQRARNEVPDVIVLEPLENLGFAGGCNLGIHHDVNGPLAERYDYVALLNNDATVEPNWLHELTETMSSVDDVGGVASKMLFADRYAPIRITITEQLAERRFVNSGYVSPLSDSTENGAMTSFNLMRISRRS